MSAERIRTTTATDPSTEQQPLLRWQQVFGVGLLLWIVSVVLLVTTEAITLVPTVILLGSFLVPVTAVAYYLDEDDSPTLGLRTVAEGFFIGGVLGIYGALILESLLLRQGPLQYLGVGLMEELAKLLALVFIARRLPRYTTRDGITLGAAVGFGFGALESSGYAFAAMLTKHGLSIADLVQTEVLRGLLAPVGHGLWTAILGGVLFHDAATGRSGRLRLTWSLVGAYLAVAVLHGLWDSMGDLAVLVTFLLTATPAQRLAVESGQVTELRPTDVQTATFMAFYWGGLAIISAIGVVWLRRMWQRGTPPAPEPAVVQHVPAHVV